MRTSLLRSLVGALLLAPLFSACVAAALGVGAGLIVSQGMLDNNTYVVRLNEDVERVWKVTKRTLSDASIELIEVDEDIRTARAKIDGADVTASVEAYDLDRSLLKVEAKKFGVVNGELAELTTRKILRELE